MILRICDEDMLDELERQYITCFDSTNPNYGYNNETGGSLNKHMSQEARRRLSEAFKGRYAGEKNPMYGRHIPCSEETKRKLSAMFSGKGNPMCGVRVKKSPELLKHLSEMYSDEGNPFYGKKHTEETKKKISDTKTKKPVRCIETKEEFLSIQEADKKTGISKGSIARSAKTGLAAGGYHWEYIV